MSSIIINNIIFCIFLNFILYINAIHITLSSKESRCFTSNAFSGDKLLGSVSIIPPEALVDVKLYKVNTNTTIPSNEKPIEDIDFSNVSYEPLPEIVADVSYWTSSGLPVADLREAKGELLESGYYSLCITNLDSTPVTAVIATRIESHSNKGLATLSTVDDLKDVLKFADRLLDTTRSIMNRMEAYSTREFLYSKIIDKMNSRIIFWSVVQMIIVIGLCCFQIYYISSFFEVKSFV